MKMEIIFQRPGTCQRREGRDVPARHQRPVPGNVPAAGRSRRASAGHQRPEIAPGNVPAAGRSRRASGGKVETCQRPGRSRRASAGKVETCQRPEGRDVPAPGTSGGHQRPEIAPGNVPAAGKVETCQRRAPAAGRSRRASAGHQRREGRDVPAAGRSRRASGGHQRPPAAQSALSVFAQQSSIFGRSRIQLYRIYRLILQARICGPERGNSVITLVDGALDTTVTTDNHVNPARIAIDGMTGI